MVARITITSLLVLVILPLSSVQSYRLYGNANVFTGTDDYTVNTGGISASAIAIDESGIIVGVGTEEEIRASLGSSGGTEEETAYYDMKGQMILPGFQDAHLHAVEAGINEQICYIDYDADLYDIVPFYLDSCPNKGVFGDQGWIMGAGIDIAELLYQVITFGYEWPVVVLDRAFPDTPVLILDSLGHGAVVNSKAMELVGYLDLLTDPQGAKIYRSPDDGSMTGIVGEDAQQVFRSAAFPPTDANKEIAYESLLFALRRLNAEGITTVSDAGGFWRQAQTESWMRVESEGLMTVRASNALYVYPDTPIDEQLIELTSRYTNDPTKLVRFNQAKIYVDGILDLETSAMSETYQLPLQFPSSEGGEYGFEYFGNEDTLKNVATSLSNSGFQLHFHVTGDRGAKLALNAIEVSNQSSGPHRLTHCYLVAEADHGRFQELNAVADFQLASSSVNLDYEEYIAGVIGTNRTDQLLPAVSILNTGAVVTLSSDWDADELSPLSKLKTVLTRPGDGKAIPNLAAALRMYTLNPAILLNHDDKTGTIEVGKLADLAVVDKNLFELPVEQLDSAKIVATFLEGKPVYDPQGVFGDSLGTMPPDGVSRMFDSQIGWMVGFVIWVSYLLV